MKKIIALGITCSLLAAGAVYVKTSGEGDGKLTQEEQLGTDTLSDLAASFKSNPNLDNSVQIFLKKWVKDNEESLSNVLSLTESMEGYYAYGANIIAKDGNSFTFDLGATKVEVVESKVKFYKGFEDISIDSNQVINGVAVVKYSGTDVESIEFRSVEVPVDDLRYAVLNADLSTGADEYGMSKEEGAYKDLTVSDWHGMSNSTVKEAVATNLAPPVFLVPIADLTVADSMIDHPYYIIVGTVIETDNKQIKLKTYEDKNVTVDIQLEHAVLNQPAFIHVMVDKGKVVSAAAQTFEDADLNIVSMGVLSYIGTSAVGR